MRQYVDKIFAGYSHMKRFAQRFFMITRSALAQ